jgi:hypothetical protein
MTTTGDVGNRAGAANPTEKNQPGSYAPPVLIEVGSLENLTGTASGSDPDGGTFQSSGVGG